MENDYAPLVWIKPKKPTVNIQRAAGSKKVTNLISDDPDCPKKIDRKASQQIQQARLAAKLTQEQLAKKLFVTSAVIKNYEAGTAIPKRDFINKLNKALNTRIEL